jgi:hypothetical protein
LVVSIDNETDLLPYGHEKQYRARVLSGRKQARFVRPVWTSSNADVIAISSRGYAASVGAGSAYLIASISGHADTITVTVTDVVHHMALAPQAASVPPGEALRFAVEGESLPAGAAEFVKWRSSDSTVVRVDKHGNVMAISEGSAELTATLGRQARGGFHKSCAGGREHHAGIDRDSHGRVA